MRRTFYEWEKSCKSWTDFAEAGDEVDSMTYSYFLGILPPIHKPKGFLVGEPYDSIGGVFSFMAFNEVDEKYFYLGIKTEEEMK